MSFIFPVLRTSNNPSSFDNKYNLLSNSFNCSFNSGFSSVTDLSVSFNKRFLRVFPNPSNLLLLMA